MIDWDKIDYSKTRGKTVPYIALFNDPKSNVNLDDHESIPKHKSNELIGACLKTLSPVINQALLLTVIHQANIGLQLSRNLLVSVKTQDNKNETGDEYEVKFKDQYLFSFYTKRGSSFNPQEGIFPVINMSLVVNMNGTIIDTERVLDFYDDDAKYLMKEFPYYFKIVKYVLTWFMKELSKKIGIKYDVEHLTNDNVYFLEDPIDDEDENMRNILQKIYADRLSRNLKLFTK